MKRALSIGLNVFWILYGCASITTPTGGPKDLRPPRLVSSNPKNNQTDFKGETVELIFNEDVTLNSPKEEIILSPSPGKEVEMLFRRTRVTITPANGWKENTTYNILFREGVKDVTEGNSPPNLRLAFSTGPIIDSLRLTGKITDRLTGKPLDKVTVAIYDQDTFDLFTHTPEYFSKTGKSGNFSLRNIKAGTYRIYAFDDHNKNLKVESRTESFGFVSRELNLNTHIDSLDIGLVRIDSRPMRITSIRNVGTSTRVRLNKNITDYTIKSDADLVHAFGDDQGQVTVWHPSNLSDSVRVEFAATDSLQNKFDSSFYVKNTSTKPLKEAFKWSIVEPTVVAESGKVTTSFKFNKPVTTIDFDSIYFLLDSTTRIPVTKSDITIDEIHKMITLEKNLDKKIFIGDVDPELRLLVRTGFIHTIENDTSKNLNSAVTILWPEDTGILLLEVQTKEPNYIIELFDGRRAVRSSINTPKITYKNLLPGTYQLRAIIDTNQNKRWDAGNIKENREPERIIYYISSDGKDTFPMRANWEYGPLIFRF